MFRMLGGFRTRAAGVLAVGLLATVALLPAVPASADLMTVGAFQGSVPIETTGGGGTATVTFVAQSPTPGVLRIEFADVVLDADGRWQVAELGSTDYTLDTRIVAVPAEFEYGPDDVGTRRTYEVTLRTFGLDDRERVGYVTARFDPVVDPAAPDAEAAFRPAIRVRLGSWPAALEGADLGIAVRGLRLARDPDAPRGRIDRAIPDLLPRVINRGPAIVRADTVNTGQALLQTETRLTLARVPWSVYVPFFRPERLTVIDYTDLPRLLLPTESRSSSVPSTISLPGDQPLDRLPFFGPVQVTAEASGYLGVDRVEDAAAATYLVAPWKEALVALVAYLAVRRAWRRMRTSLEQRARDEDEVEDMSDGEDEEPVGVTTDEGSEDEG